MALKITIESASELREQFINYNRDNYSYDAYQALYEYYDELEDMELDVIAICCDWSELSINQVIRDYSIDLSDITDDNGDIDNSEKLELVMKYLNDRTYAIYTNGGFLFQCF
jgi:aspartate/glutamate racemase